MRVLITGASGFVGSHIAEGFVRDQHTVRAMVRPHSRTEFLRELGVEVHPYAALRDAMQGVAVVVHAAARVDPHGHWREFQAGTVEGMRTVLSAAADAGVPHFIYISSVGVYQWPRARGATYDEASPYGEPFRWSYYARAKIAAERIITETHQRGIIATTILRPSWVYGPRDFTIFVRIAEALRAGRLKRIGDGGNRLNLIYATDVADAVRLAATQPASRGQIYNVSADETAPSQEQFIARVCALLALPVPTRSMSYRLAHRLGFLGESVAHLTRFNLRPPLTRLSVLLLGADRRFKNQKLRDELGWQPRVGFEEGIMRTCDWYRGTR